MLNDFPFQVPPSSTIYLLIGTATRFPGWVVVFLTQPRVQRFACLHFIYGYFVKLGKCCNGKFKDLWAILIFQNCIICPIFYHNPFWIVLSLNDMPIFAYSVHGWQLQSYQAAPCEAFYSVYSYSTKIFFMLFLLHITCYSCPLVRTWASLPLLCKLSQSLVNKICINI